MLTWCPPMFIKCCKISLTVFVLITIFHPERHAKHYPYIPVDEMLPQLVMHDQDMLSHGESCTYNNLIRNNSNIKIEEITKKYYVEALKSGGEYIPSKCKPLYKSAIIIPYRNRKEQLQIFLNYMHHFLQNQNIQYRIYLVEQKDDEPFNRAKMFNVGATVAMDDGFPCIILHDVDLIPLTTGNIYACSKCPRHMSSNIDLFRYNVPYVELFGGVISITTDQYKLINGMSNMYVGWGGEDDDLYRRLKEKSINTCRFSSDFSKYTMLKHKKETPGAQRYEMLKTSLERQKTDGLNSMKQNYVIENNELYTHIQVLDI